MRQGRGHDENAIVARPLGARGAGLSRLATASRCAGTRGTAPGRSPPSPPAPADSPSATPAPAGAGSSSRRSRPARSAQPRSPPAEIRRMSSFWRTDTSVKLAWSTLGSRVPRPSAPSTRCSRWTASCTSPSLTTSSAATQLAVLTTATSSSSATSRLDRLAAEAIASTSGPGRPNSAWTAASSWGLGVAQADPDEAVAQRPGVVGVPLTPVGRSHAGHRASWNAPAHAAAVRFDARPRSRNHELEQVTGGARLLSHHRARRSSQVPLGVHGPRPPTRATASRPRQARQTAQH
jgi:hypothetical protein